MEKAVIWGVTQTPPNLLRDVGEKYEIVGWVDRNEEMHQQYLNGKKIYSPDEMNNILFDKVILGAASYRASRQICMECLLRGIKQENVITDYTLKNRSLSLKDIFLMQHKVGKECRLENFNRFNLLIQYAFIGQYFGENTIGYELADRYMRLTCIGEEKVDNSFECFVELIKSIEETGFQPESYLSLNKEGWLIDGTHRMAAMLYMKYPVAWVDILNTNWNIGENGERNLKWLCEKGYTPKEIRYLEKIYEEIAEYIDIDKSFVRRQVDLWERDRIW